MKSLVHASVSGGFYNATNTRRTFRSCSWHQSSLASGQRRLFKELKRLDISIDFKRGATFPCPVCGDLVPVHDTVEKTWRHMNFFQYETYLKARTPRVKCPKDGCGVKLVTVPWARSGSGFTLLFEALATALAREMPIKIEAAHLGEHDMRWPGPRRFLRSYASRH